MVPFGSVINQRLSSISYTSKREILTHSIHLNIGPGATSIRDVIAFPLLRAEKAPSAGEETK